MGNLSHLLFSSTLSLLTLEYHCNQRWMVTRQPQAWHSRYHSRLVDLGDRLVQDKVAELYMQLAAKEEIKTYMLKDLIFLPQPLPGQAKCVWLWAPKWVPYQMRVSQTWSWRICSAHAASISPIYHRPIYHQYLTNISPIYHQYITSRCNIIMHLRCSTLDPSLLGERELKRIP